MQMMLHLPRAQRDLKEAIEIIDKEAQKSEVVTNKKKTNQHRKN